MICCEPDSDTTINEEISQIKFEHLTHTID